MAIKKKTKPERKEKASRAAGGKPSKAVVPAKKKADAKPPKGKPAPVSKAKSSPSKATKVPAPKASARDVGKNGAGVKTAKGPAPVATKGSKAGSATQKSVPEKKPAPRLSRPSLPPPLPPPKPKTLEERTVILQKRLAQTPADFQEAYQRRLDMSWIYHDSAIEGVVYTEQELTAAMDPEQAMPSESNLQPVCDEIQRHREAIRFARECGADPTVEISVDLVKKLFLILHPDEGDVKTVRYRKDIPQHRLYFHEYSQPDKIAAKVKAVVDWINDPEVKSGRGTVRFATRAHYDLLRIFPFQTDSGKVARLLLNILLLRGNLLPAIIHMSDRQRYYEALKGSPATMVTIVHDAIENNLSSIEKLIEHYEARRAP
ncbi:MAG: Fic family protein [Polyangiaceae bacterium]